MNKQAIRESQIPMITICSVQSPVMSNRSFLSCRNGKMARNGWLPFNLETCMGNVYNKKTKYKVLTMVSPGCIPARMASI